MEAHLLGSIIFPFDFPNELAAQINRLSQGRGGDFVRLLPTDFPGKITSSV